MSVTHATPSTVGTPAAGHIPTAGSWDAAHTGTNDHGHTATADGGLIAPITAARTATADGLTTGIIAAAGLLSFVTVTSGNAAHIVTLPAPVPGTVIIIDVGANGFKLQSSAPSTVAINGGTGASAKSTIAASSTLVMVCVSATAWKGFYLDADSDVAKVAAAA